MESAVGEHDPDIEPHKHKSLVELFEALLSYSERRFGMTAQQGIDLLRSVEESERVRRDILRGIWTALIVLVCTGIGSVVVLGIKVWVFK